MQFSRYGKRDGIGINAGASASLGAMVPRRPIVNCSGMERQFRMQIDNPISTGSSEDDNVLVGHLIARRPRHA